MNPDLSDLIDLNGVVMRLVEQQGAEATRRLTDSLDEQAWLERFLEDSKPDAPDAKECPLRHRLLLAPFRYQKRHGSRFASRWERGLFYGSRSRFGCLVEGAYYEFVFQSGPERPFPKCSALRKTLFHVEMRTPMALKLQNSTSSELQRKLRDPVDTNFCQQLGQNMREAGIHAFEYHSARCKDDVVQVGVISCCVFSSMPFDHIDVQMEASADQVIFHCLDDHSVNHFDREQFLVNGYLPKPS